MPLPRHQPDVIDGKAIKSLVETRTLHSATILGQPGGWSVVVRYGALERAVAAQRAQRARLWRNLDTAVRYVRDELGLPRFEVDSHGHAPEAIQRRRPDTAQRQQRAHEAMAHDAWFRAEVAAAMEKADAAQAQWIPHAMVMSQLDARIARLNQSLDTVPLASAP